MLEMLVNSTNAKLRSVRQAHRLDIQETDRAEMPVFFGLMHLRGLLGMNTHEISKLHEPAIGQALLIRGTMSKNRF